MRSCPDCGARGGVDVFYSHKIHKDGLSTRCRSCCKRRVMDNPNRNINRAKSYQKHPVMAMISAAKTRARDRGLDFDLKEEWIAIPPVCPVLGIPLFFPDRIANIGSGTGTRHSDHSPSLDRIDPHGGYVRDNVIVVSMRANRIKNDASLDELRKICEFYTRLVKGRK